MNLLRDAFWVFVLGLVACFAFFFALGAVTTEAVGLIAVMCGLAVMWLGHAWLESRHRHECDLALTHARERRGF